MFRWELLVAGVAAGAGAWAGVIEGDSNDSKPRRITLYVSREFILRRL